MRRLRRDSLVLVLLQLLATGAALAATVAGTVKYQGEVPKLKPIAMDADPTCAAKHSGPVASEMLVLGEGNTLANIFVKVKSGLPAKEWPAPKQPAVLDQKGCRYAPHVLGVMVNQPFKILNSDGVLHNVHALPTINKQFNKAMPASVTEAVETFTKVEGKFTIKCDVHPWMSAFVEVMAHPFFDVTEKDGRYTISDLPAGTYEIEVWHERLGTKTEKITVGATDTKTLDFTLSPPAK